MGDRNRNRNTAPRKGENNGVRCEFVPRQFGGQQIACFSTAGKREFEKNTGSPLFLNEGVGEAQGFQSRLRIGNLRRLVIRADENAEQVGFRTLRG
jgi:hypothetical protein